MDSNTQARICLFLLGILLFIITALHQLFPTWKVFCNKNTREILSEMDALRYEKKSSFGFVILGLFAILSAVPPVSLSWKSMVVFLNVGILLYIFYQVSINYKCFGTFSYPHHSGTTRFCWLRQLIYILVLILLFRFLLPYEGLNLFVKVGIISLAAGVGSKFANG